MKGAPSLTIDGKCVKKPMNGSISFLSDSTPVNGLRGKREAKMKQNQQDPDHAIPAQAVVAQPNEGESASNNVNCWQQAAEPGSRLNVGSSQHPDLTPIERFTVVLAALASPCEVHRLRLFFEEWDGHQNRKRCALKQAHMGPHGECMTREAQ